MNTYEINKLGSEFTIFVNTEIELESYKTEKEAMDRILGYHLKHDDKGVFVRDFKFKPQE